MRLNTKNRTTLKKSKAVGELRRTQLITSFGSGALAAMPDYSIIMAATDFWSNDSQVLRDRNLEKLLKVNYFKEPKVTYNENFVESYDIPSYRFPTMHFCPECNRLMPYWKFDREDGKKCLACDKKLIPSRFIAACTNGHLEDFPYHWWAHNGRWVEECKDAPLKITFSDETGGLESILIECTKCGSKRTMEGCMNKGALKGYRCWGKRPWIGHKSDSNDSEPCNAPMRALQRGASNVYFPVTASALTIPPWSGTLHSLLNKDYEKIKGILTLNLDIEQLEKYAEVQFKEFLQNYPQYTAKDLAREIKAYEAFENRAENDNYDVQDLLEDEYKMFLCRDYSNADDVQFRIESTKVADELADYIDDVILVKRLREVLALKGFRRILPDEPNTRDEAFAGNSLTKGLVPLSKNELDWLPAIEMLGEGLFIKINEGKLTEWENENSAYYHAMAKRLEDSNVICENFSPRYVLLHTLSHLLIRQLALECGYSDASLKERIYSTYLDSNVPMSGILLYTSTSDSDGSLGGLVRKGLPDSFKSTFYNMLQEASWCSSDPICIESKSQGYDSLNYAACHACTLLPETSCVMRNCLLDRCSVVGSGIAEKKGFFSGLMDE